jgi:hypothetical protein
MAEYLIVAEAVAPVAEGEVALAASGLARALVAAKHRVTLLSLGDPEHVARIPGMARRLRTVAATAGGASLDLPLFEGRTAHAQAQLYVLGTPARNRGFTCAVLASAAGSLARDGLVAPRVVIGWDETAASSVSSVAASTRLFVLPTGASQGPLTAEERAALGADDDLAGGSLLALGIVGAHALVVPSASAARALERDHALAARASDEPIVPVRFGCDEPPHDPGADPALAAAYSAESPAGKAECRRALARRGSLAVGPRTLLLAAPLLGGPGGKAVLEAIARLVRFDVVVVVPAGGDRALADRANVLAIEHPGKLALLTEAGDAADRQLLAGVDAVLLADVNDRTGRAAGLALRYGAVPIAPDAGANADHLVDHDPASGTGSALLYAPVEAYEIEGAVRRALALRGDAEAWQRLVRSLLQTAPRWNATVAVLESLEVGEQQLPAEKPAELSAGPPPSP